jgi:hypothetical protein
MFFEGHSSGYNDTGLEFVIMSGAEKKGGYTDAQILSIICIAFTA